MDPLPRDIELEHADRPAPDALRLVQSFVNSRDVEARSDDWSDPPALGAWLAARRLVEPRVEADALDLVAAVGLREALRALLLENAGHGTAGGAEAALDEAAARARLRPRFEAPGSVRLEAEAPGIAGALGRIVAIAAQAMAEGRWPRLKACSNDACQWAFYDSSRNRSGRWCSGEDCGNQLRARAFRARQRAG
jgi:predicted RNA-binding Zn ribbon-like protein